MYRPLGFYRPRTASRSPHNIRPWHSLVVIIPTMDSLERIASDAASLSVSYTATSSSGTIRGLGSDSGRVIMALGEGTLRVMESLGVEWKLRDTARRVRTTRPSLWSSEDLLDIMEYQR